MKKITLLIIDDEEDARELIKHHLSDVNDVEILGEAKDGKMAISMIEHYKPDLILLDIEMPELNGLEVIKKISHVPQIIFITAFNDYAVNAFEIHAVDYLLKPFTANRLKEAIERVHSRMISSAFDKELYLNLLSSFSSGSQYLNRVSVRSNNKTHFIDVQNIVLIEASDQYVTLQTASQKFVLRQSMDYFEKALNPKKFIRTHRSYIVSIENVLSIEQYEPKTLIIHLKGDFKAKLSQSRKVLFEGKLHAG